MDQIDGYILNELAADWLLPFLRFLIIRIRIGIVIR